MTMTELKALHEVVRTSMERNHVPGVVVGIADGEQDLIEAYGVTNLNHPLPVTADTLFQIGSTTKTVTGTAVMRLVEAGKIDLDAAVRTYLPDFQVADPETAANVTVRHLLTHTAGWEGDFFTHPDRDRGDDALERAVAAMADRPQLSPIGEIWAYNNAAFYALGRIIELVTGQVYETAVRELVLNPLGMNNSFFFPEEVMTRRFAVGHVEKDGEWQVARRWQLPRSANAAGGLVSTAADQLRYARFHLGDGTAADGTRLLSPESMQLMQTPYASADNGSQIALTWFVKETGGVRTIEHGGTTSGQYSAFLIAPEHDFAITVFTNGGYSHALDGEVVNWALQQFLGIEATEPQPIEATPEQLAEVTGRYETSTAAHDITLHDGQLSVQIIPLKAPGWSQEVPPPSPVMRARLLAGDNLRIEDPPMAGRIGEFLRGPDGAITWLRIGKRIWRKTS